MAAAILRCRVDQLERRAEVCAEVERQLAAQPQQAIEAPQQHLHVHGVTLAHVIAARQQDDQRAVSRGEDRPAIESGPPW